MSTELLIDIGHSRIKWGWLDDAGLDRERSGRAADESAASALLNELAGSDVRRARVCASPHSPTGRTVLDALEQRGMEVDIITTGDRPLPVAPAYPGLGCDRWLAMQWPWQQQRSALVVIDCGSAITVDIVDAAGQHLGGWIMPGMAAARRGLFERAPGLQQCLPEPGPIGMPARATGDALARGELMLALGGIERAIDAAERSLGQSFGLWLTGGDAARLAAELPRPARLEDHLVLLGLSLTRQ